MTAGHRPKSIPGVPSYWLGLPFTGFEGNRNLVAKSLSFSVLANRFEGHNLFSTEQGPSHNALDFNHRYG